MRASRTSPIAFPVTPTRSTRPKTTRVNRTLTSDLFDRIRLDILHCRLQPGSRLLFRDLRSAYGSGQSPLREALMRLASEQLVVLEDHKGFRVAPVSPEEALDIANSRCELEGLAVRMAIATGDDQWESNIIARFHELSKRATYGADGKLDPEWERRHGLRIVEGLGSTEVLHIYISNNLERQKPGASGARVPGYEIKLCDPDGNSVRVGEAGIMWVRGDSNAPFYWNRPDKTRETMRDGWIYTGDRFREDADGYFWFEGRADDLVKVSGQWVHPMEVERALAEHPTVRECAVLAVEDENRLMTLRAYVALRPGHVADAATTRTLQDFVKRALVPFKYPRTIEYLEELPKTGTGKIDRLRLRTMSKA